MHANATSPDGTSAWFPSGKNNYSGWQFDIVGLLTVIGESSIEEHVQVITASPLSYVPRLIPAPQALCKTDRPRRLPSIKNVDVVGVHSGMKINELNYFANAIHGIEELQEFEFREYTIDYTEEAKKEKNKRVDNDEQKRNAKRSQVLAEGKRSDIELASKIPAATTFAASKVAEKKIHISMRRGCAINIVTVLSVAMTIGLLVTAFCIHDGVACIAILTISMSTSLACLSSQWLPQLSERPSSAQVPKGDIVIRTRGGAMIVVHCPEEITRELYTATEKCDYLVDKRVWSALVGMSTILLMISIVLLGNCQWIMQAIIGLAYIILNAVYWALPFFSREGTIWNMEKRFKITHHKHKERHYKALENDKHGNRASYTRALAYAIEATEATEWVTKGDFAPSTEGWNKWLGLARDHLQDPDWNAVKAKDVCMEEEKAKQDRPTA